MVDGGTGSFLVGAVLSWLWLLLRWWSITVLDHYFTTVLNTGPDQMVGKRGPYGVLRHPGDTGLLIGPGLACSPARAHAAVPRHGALTRRVRFPRLHGEAQTSSLHQAGRAFRLSSGRGRRLGESHPATHGVTITPWGGGNIGFMYVPRLNVMPEPEVGDFLQAHPVGQLVTVGADGVPDVTLLPILLDSVEGQDRVVAHLARANDHWRRIVDGSPALLVVTGADAYVSPSWYASKAEHGRVVPTWNYSAVHLRGPVTTHDDVDWVRNAVTRLTERHEGERAAPWAVSDAPEKYVTGQLKGVVGIEMTIEKIEAKAKLSQNRSDDDRSGVIAGLRGESDRSGVSGPMAVASAVEKALNL